VKAMLKKNNGYIFSDQFRQVQNDIREYLEGNNTPKNENT
jgi:hypothetical protein